MSKEQTYNGWKNYETWNVKLWIDNEQSTCNYWRAVAREIWDDTEDTEFEGPDSDLHDPDKREHYFTTLLADSLKEHFEQAAQDLLENANAQASMWADLLGAALSEVDWYEIAEHYLDDVKEAA